MLSFDDPRWDDLQGGYRMRYDPRPTLRKLERGDDIPGCWEELWGELHHQGDVGLASYAAIPHLARLARSLPPDDWNVFGLVGTISILAGQNQNPKIPDWMEPAHTQALHDLAEVARDRVGGATDKSLVTSCLGLIALSAGLPHHAELLLHFEDDEVAEFLSQYAAG